MSWHHHICGCYFVILGSPGRNYLPQLSLSAKSKIVSSTSRTTLTQTFANPREEPISELRYTFPLYDGVSVVGFVCTINGDRVIRGVVKERAEARKTYKAAVDRGETAGLLEQLPSASDVFTTTIGNVPANAKIEVDITYLGELKHDAEVDGIRFTIPTHVAPRYGSYPGPVLSSTALDKKGGITIVVDVEMPNGCNVKSVQSPSHPIAVTLGNTSAGAASGADMSLQKASATLALSKAELGDDFVLQVVATNTGNPVAVLETHPTIPNHRALMATLVPKFNLPSSKPEIVFLCDRSGSMHGYKIANLKVALQLFLKSLPVGVKFNICSFGTRYDFLFPNGSRTYDESSLLEATHYIDNFAANLGGTDIYKPMEAVFKQRYTDMDLEVFLLTDGEIWDQGNLFDLLNKQVAESNGRIRVFSLGIGRDASHALIEGVAAAGNGFAQSVGDNENMNSKVVRMLKASLTPHVKDYALEVKYDRELADSDDDFEIVEKVMDALAIEVQEPEKAEPPKKTISLFDESANPDVDMTDAGADTSAGGKYSHVPPVPEPKILQAPFTIPPLFPFNRTSVYLLLSPETIQKQPKSVVLRGTSPYGPVELEIPVTVLPEKGETIHQLAARKAVKELEEGRGWIFHARDAKDATGALLKDKHPGRFNDMVEREAVRLGVTYQVGGKWCSFVAVEANSDGSEKEAEQPSTEESAAADPGYGERDRDRSIRPIFRTYCAAAAPRVQLAAKAARKLPPPDESRMRHRRIFSWNNSVDDGVQAEEDDSSEEEGFLRQEVFTDSSPQPLFAQQMSFGAAPPPPPAPPIMPGQQNSSSSRSRSGGGGLYGNFPGGQTGAATTSVFSSPAPHPPPPPPGSGLQMMMGMSAARVPSRDGQVPRSGLFSLSRQDQTHINRAPAPLQGADKLRALVALQTFSGAWKWTDELMTVLGLGKDFAAPTRLGGERDKLATALVLACLEGELAGLKDEWEMVAEKAREWLKGVLEKEGLEGVTVSVEGYCDEAKGLLRV